MEEETKLIRAIKGKVVVKTGNPRNSNGGITEMDITPPLVPKA